MSHVEGRTVVPRVDAFRSITVRVKSLLTTVIYAASLPVVGGMVLANEAPSDAPTQVKAGAGSYAEHCASCHGQQLTGTTHAPGLSGAAFLKSWEGKPSRQLYSRIISTMPLSAPGSLEPAMALDITAFVLWVNKQAIVSSGYKAADELNDRLIKSPDSSL